MTVKEVTEKVEKMIQEKSYYLNSNKTGSEVQRKAWEYARENLLYVLKLLRKVSKPQDEEISTNEEKEATRGCTGICRAKKKGSGDGAWYIGEAVTFDGRAFILVSNPEFVNGKIGEWMEVDPDTVQRYTGKEDDSGNRLFEGDVVGTMSRTVRMEICYGRYGAFCPHDREYMENIGFFVVSNTTEDAMPLGPTENYAHLLGNVVDNPALRVI